MWTRIKEHWALIAWLGVFTGAMLYAFSGYKEEKFWHRWEHAAIASTSVYAVIVYCGAFYAKFFRRIKRGFLGLVVVFLGFALVALGCAFYVSWNSGSIAWHLAWLLAAATCFICVDCAIAHQRSGALKATRELHKRAMLFSDIPIGIGFALLLFYAILVPSHGIDEIKCDKCGNKCDEIRAFFGGAIALQMLLSSWVCALSFHGSRSTKTSKK